jgi:beta-aspartyl-peptidase (threonine type)
MTVSSFETAEHTHSFISLPMQSGGTMCSIHLKKYILLCLFSITLTLIFWSCSRQSALQVEFGMVVHGGAGTILRENMTPELEEAYRAKLAEALQAGYAILQSGGKALDAVETAIIVMEDSPLFNAGKGAVFNSEGNNELDASLMDGETLQAGAVAGVRRVKNPIRLARIVMDNSPHVLMAGAGAEQFGTEQGIEFVSEDYFYTQQRWDQLQKAIEKEKAAGEHGTVGAVALDRNGSLAAGTSTGGMTNKRFGRIGDSPIIAAGTYADNRTCAVSCTGHGEYFIRLAIAHDVSALMDYQGLPIAEASNRVITEKLGQLGGTGGLIAIDKNGNIATPFNTSGMYRGYIDELGTVVTQIFQQSE